MLQNFSSQFISWQFFLLLKVFILTKNLNVAHTHTKIKQNLLHLFFSVKVFVSFVKLLSIRLDQSSLSFQEDNN